jgi:hypothetical protein
MYDVMLFSFFLLYKRIDISYLWLLLYADMETNECLANNGGCWKDKAANITACRVFG